MADASDIKLAYLLLAHKNPEQINLFVGELLANGDCDVYIHVDKKNAAIIPEIVENEHVIVCSEYETRWASFEICRAALKLMELAVSSGKGYSHIYFGSGQDLMVKRGLYGHLAENPDVVFMHIIREVTARDRAAARYKIRWSKKLMKRGNVSFSRFARVFLQTMCRMGIVFKRNKKTLKKQVRFYTGGTWFVAPIAAAKYIVDYTVENPDYVEFWQDSLASDLMFFQTILMNSEYKDTMQEQLTYIRFGTTKRTHNHPMTVTIADDEQIENGKYFFARKFEIAERDTIDYYIGKVVGKPTEADE